MTAGVRRWPPVSAGERRCPPVTAGVRNFVPIILNFELLYLSRRWAYGDRSKTAG